MAEPAQMIVVQVRADDGWKPVAAIDGRRYPDEAAVRRVRSDALDILEQYEVPAQFVSRDVKPTDRQSPLPTWEEYRAILTSQGTEDPA